MDLSTIQVIKDDWDYLNIIATVLCGIISLILIYKCSAMLSDKVKKYEKEYNSLNYLTICVNRYMKHVLGIWNIVEMRKAYLKDYILEPTDRIKFFKAFQIIRPPIPNFEIYLPDYAFTVQKQPLLVDSLLRYIEKYSEVIETINFFNRETDIVIHSDIPQEKIVDLAQTSLKESMEESNLFRWEVAICFTIYELNHLLELIHEYQCKNKYKNFVWIDVQGYRLEKVKQAEAFLDKHCPDPNWRYSLIDPQDKYKQASWFKTFYQNLFSMRNEYTHKVIRVLGFKIKLQRKKFIENTNISTIININKIQTELLNRILNMLSPINNASHNMWCKLDDILKELKKNDNK